MQSSAAASAHGDAAAFRGELHRVRQQIERDLLEGAAVGAQMQVGRDFRDQLEVLVLRPGRDDAHGIGQQRVELEILEIEADAASLDLRHVEDVVDDVEQILPAAADVAAILAVFLGAERAEHARLHDLGETDDGVERRAQLVAHIGEEFRLGLVGFLGAGLLDGVVLGEFGQSLLRRTRGRRPLPSAASRYAPAFPRASSAR